MFISISRAGSIVRLEGGERKTVSHVRTPKVTTWDYEYFSSKSPASPSLMDLKRALNKAGSFIKDNDLGMGEYSIMTADRDQIRVSFPWVSLGPTTVELIARYMDSFMDRVAWKSMQIRLRMDPMGKHQALYIEMQRYNNTSTDAKRLA